MRMVPFKRVLSSGRSAGFSLIELIIAFCIIVVGFFTFFSVFSTSSQHAVQTQNRAAAILLAQGYIDDFLAHPFGSPAPAIWSVKEERPVRLVVKDRETEFIFHKLISYKTGAFIDGTKGDSDQVKLTISWREQVGANQVKGLPAGERPDPDDNKMIQIEVPVWR